MHLSVQIIVRIGGKLLSHLQKTFSFEVFFPTLPCKTKDFSSFWEEGRMRENLKKGLLPGRGMLRSVVGSLCSRPSCKPGTARTGLLGFPESLPGFGQYFHLALRKDFHLKM